MKYRLLVILIVIGALGLVSAFTYAQNEPIVTITPAASSVIQQDIFVRGGPGRDYLPVGKLLVGDRVRPLSRNDQGDWVLIVYGKNYGWIRRDLAFWVENIDALPVMDTANLTPSPVIPTTPANTPVLAATDTPVGNWVELNTDAQSGYVRAGPGRTYLRLGQLYTGDEVEPVSQNADGSWIMIRFGDGFGWISRSLVRWIDNIDALPVIATDNLTPTATYTVTSTSSATATSTTTFTPTFTATATFTSTVTITPSATPTSTSTQTATVVPSATYTLTPIPSVTPLPTLTATFIPSEMPQHIVAPTLTVVPSQMPAPTDVPIIPTQTHTLIVPTSTPLPPTQTNTPLPTATSTELATVTATLSATIEETAVAVVIVPSSTATLLPTNTPTEVIPTATVVPPTSTFAPSLTFTAGATPLPASATLSPATLTEQQATSTLVITHTVVSATQAITATMTSSPTVIASNGAVVSTALPTPTLPVSDTQPGTVLSPEALIAGIVLLVIGIYGFLYWRGLSTAERYANGFVIDTCPVCQRGHLIVESRQERLFGVPRARHSVRCSACRSVLREVGNQQWRYAVDPMENPDLYQRYNGQVISDDVLVDLVAEQTGVKRSNASSDIGTPPNSAPDEL